MTDHGPLCPECGECCMEDHKACPACGHCAGLHGFDGVYCRWQSPGGIICACLLTKTQAMDTDIERWPEDEEA